MNCSTCKHWKPAERLLDSLGRASAKGIKAGECRCRAPWPVRALGGDWRAFPSTIATDYCSEFVQGDAAVVEEKKPVRQKKVDEKPDKA